jgi:hypothetical protein
MKPNESLTAFAGQPQTAHASHFVRRLRLPLSSALGLNDHGQGLSDD